MGEKWNVDGNREEHNLKKEKRRRKDIEISTMINRILILHFQKQEYDHVLLECSYIQHLLLSKLLNKFPPQHSEYEWMGITTNSDDLSYSSESDGGWDDNEESDQTFLRSEALDWNIQGSPAAIITSAPNVSDKGTECFG